MELETVSLNVYNALIEIYVEFEATVDCDWRCIHTKRAFCKQVMTSSGRVLETSGAEPEEVVPLPLDMLKKNSRERKAEAW